MGRMCRPHYRVARMYECSDSMRPALEHRQLPILAHLIVAQDVDAPIVTLDFDVSIIRSVPLIEYFDHLDMPAAIELQAARHLHSEMADAVLDANMHTSVLSSVLN